MKKLIFPIIIIIILLIALSVIYTYTNNKKQKEINEIKGTDLILYIQDKEIAMTRDCGVTKKVIYKIPQVIDKANTILLADTSLKILFDEELSRYGVYESVNITDEIAKIMLKSDKTQNGSSISSLSSCESMHLLSVLNDTLTQDKNIKSIELYSPQGIIQF